MAEKDREQAILNYLDSFGLLLCNENRYLPSLFDVGGDWDSIVSLIEKRKVFYCKIFRKRTSYVSRELYFLLKEYKQSTLCLPALSSDIYDFLSDNGPADTETIKNILMLDKKSFDKAFDILLEKVLVTAVKRGKTLGQTWSTFIWGTYGEWEKGISPQTREKAEFDRIFDILGSRLTEKEILRIIKRV